MKSGRFGIISVSALTVGALALMVFRWSAASEAVYPFERLVNFADRVVWSRVVGLFAGAEAFAENERLRREVADLSLLRGDLERLRLENDRLRRALDYAPRRTESWIAAEVLSADGGAFAARRSVRVGKGSLDGVREGAVVAAPEGLVGRVARVSPHTSEIMLLSDVSVKVACAVGADASGRVHGILSGGDADGLLLRHFDRPERLRPPAAVVTSGLGGVFPPGFEVGTLVLVTNGVRGVEGEVRPCVNFSMLEDVFIRREP